VWCVRALGPDDLVRRPCGPACNWPIGAHAPGRRWICRWPPGSGKSRPKRCKAAPSLRNCGDNADFLPSMTEICRIIWPKASHMCQAGVTLRPASKLTNLQSVCLSVTLVWHHDGVVLQAGQLARVQTLASRRGVRSIRNGLPRAAVLQRATLSHPPVTMHVPTRAQCATCDGTLFV
jgi:hypothetical protein